jgi:hypothetical protein
VFLAVALALQYHLALPADGPFAHGADPDGLDVRMVVAISSLLQEVYFGVLKGFLNERRGFRTCIESAQEAHLLKGYTFMRIRIYHCWSAGRSS